MRKVTYLEYINYMTQNDKQEELARAVKSKHSLCMSIVRNLGIEKFELFMLENDFVITGEGCFIALKKYGINDNIWQIYDFYCLNYAKKEELEELLSRLVWQAFFHYDKTTIFISLLVNTDTIKLRDACEEVLELSMRFDTPIKGKSETIDVYISKGADSDARITILNSITNTFEDRCFITRNMNEENL